MNLALDEARKAIPTPTAFCVGCVVAVRVETDDAPIILATGYSRELPGNTHAEANALTKALSLTPDQLLRLSPSLAGRTINDLLPAVDVYTTLEPCSVRTSGLSPCVDALVKAGIRRCYIGASEPPDFVNCQGAALLKSSGVEIVWLQGFEQESLAVARGKRSAPVEHDM